ncbi:MAG: hypothetical protein V4629_03505 [Pseudomonadota bacterium]
MPGKIPSNTTNSPIASAPSSSTSPNSTLSNSSSVTPPQARTSFSYHSFREALPDVRKNGYGKQRLTLKQAEDLLNRLDGNISLACLRSKETVFLIERLVFLSTLASALKSQGLNIEGVYLVGSLINEVVYQSTYANDCDFFFKMQNTDQLTKENLKSIISQNLIALGLEHASNYYGLSAFTSNNTQTETYVLQLGIHDTDIKITTSDLDYSFLDKAMAIDLKPYFESNDPNTLEIHYLEKKEQVENTIHFNLIEIGDKSQPSWDKLVIALKRLSEGKHFASSELAKTLYIHFIKALRLAQDEMKSTGLSSLHSTIYKKFSALNAKQLLHTILDSTARQEEIFSTTELRKSDKKIFNDFIGHMQHWFLHKAKNEQAFMALADQLVFLDKNKLVENLQHLLLLENHLRLESGVIGAEGVFHRRHLTTNIQGENLYCVINVKENILVFFGKWSREHIEELYELAFALGLENSTYYFLEKQMPQLEILQDAVPSVEQSTLSKATTSPKNYFAHWEIWNHNFKLWNSESAIEWDEKSIPKKSITINWHGKALILENFTKHYDDQGNIYRLTGLAELVLATNNSVQTHWQLCFEKFELFKDNVVLVENKIKYFGPVYFKFSRSNQLQSVKPLGFGKIVVSLTATSELNLQGHFFTRGLIQNAKATFNQQKIESLSLKWQELSQNILHCTAYGKFQLDENTDFVGEFFFDSTSLKPIKGDVSLKNSFKNASISVDYNSENFPIFVNFIFEDPNLNKTTLLYSEKFLSIRLENHSEKNIPALTLKVLNIENLQGNINDIITKTMNRNYFSGTIECETLTHYQDFTFFHPTILEYKNGIFVFKYLMFELQTNYTDILNNNGIDNWLSDDSVWITINDGIIDISKLAITYHDRENDLKRFYTIQFSENCINTFSHSTNNFLIEGFYRKYGSTDFLPLDLTDDLKEILEIDFQGKGIFDHNSPGMFQTTRLGGGGFTTHSEEKNNILTLTKNFIRVDLKSLHTKTLRDNNHALTNSFEVRVSDLDSTESAIINSVKLHYKTSHPNRLSFVLFESSYDLHNNDNLSANAIWRFKTNTPHLIVVSNKGKPISVSFSRKEKLSSLIENIKNEFLQSLTNEDKNSTLNEEKLIFIQTFVKNSFLAAPIIENYFDNQMQSDLQTLLPVLPNFLTTLNLPGLKNE